MSAPDQDNLERRLEALRTTTPVMPPDVERHIRARLVAEAQRPVRIRRGPPFPPSGGSAGQIIGVVLLMLGAGWMVTHSFIPALRASIAENQVEQCTPVVRPTITATTASPVVSHVKQMTTQKILTTKSAVMQDQCEKPVP